MAGIIVESLPKSAAKLRGCSDLKHFGPLEMEVAIVQCWGKFLHLERLDTHFARAAQTQGRINTIGGIGDPPKIFLRRKLDIWNKVGIIAGGDGDGLKDSAALGLCDTFIVWQLTHNFYIAG